MEPIAGAARYTGPQVVKRRIKPTAQSVSSTGSSEPISSIIAQTLVASLLQGIGEKYQDASLRQRQHDTRSSCGARNQRLPAAIPSG